MHKGTKLSTCWSVMIFGSYHLLLFVSDYTKVVDLLISDGNGVLVLGAHRGRARDAGQASLTNFLRDLNTFACVSLQRVCGVVETFFVTSGFGGAPRPLLSLHIGQGGVEVTMLSENTKFLST